MKISPVELLVVALVVLALFGGKIIPMITKQLKKSKSAFKESVTELSSDYEETKEAA